MAETTLDNPGIAQAVDRTYAEALFDLADEGGALAEVTDELGQIVELCAADASLKALFASKAITAERRANSIEQIFRGRISDLLYRSLHVINSKGRLDRLGGIHTALAALVKDRRGEVDVDIYTARPLDGGQLNGVADRIGAAIGRRATLHPHVDEQLLGGLKIRIGDKLVDGTVATRLKRMRRQLIEHGQELVRSDAGRLMDEET